MKELSVSEVSEVSGAGLLGAINLAVTAGWAGSVIGGRQGGNGGGILGFGIIGSGVGMVAAGLIGATGGFIKGLTQDDATSFQQSNDFMNGIISGDIGR